MDEQRENVVDLIWDRTLELFTKIHDCPDNPEHRDNLVRWLNEDPAHLKAFNELGQIWIATGITLAREIGRPLDDLEKDQPPLMTH